MERNEWLNWRNKGIGGSDCAAILGLSPYMTNVDLWEDKVLNKKKEFKGKDSFLERGHKIEPLIRAMFQIDHPEYTVEYRDNDHFTHPKYKFIRGTVDGRLTEKSTGKKGILEIKHVQADSRQQRESWKFDKIPDHYFCQVLHYLECSGLGYAVLKARIRSQFDDNLSIIEREYKIVKSEYQEQIDHLIKAEVDFWNNYVLTGKKPFLVLPPI